MISSLAKLKIALVYDRVNTSYGGAEQILLALKKLYPQAVLYTSVANIKQAKWASNFVIKTSFLQQLPLASKLHRYLATLMPLAFECLDLSAYDIVISITSAEAKGVITRRDQLHFCYLLSPPRYLYHYSEAYLSQNHLLRLPIIHSIAKLLLKYLKKWDQIAIFRPDIIVPIADIVRQRAEKYYPKLTLAHTIYPPVDSSLLKCATKENQTNQNANSYFLLVSRLVPYKNIAPAILACQKLKHKLVIVGEGPDDKKLRCLATGSTTFMQKLSNFELAKLYQNCQAVLSPGLDDFGIVAMEANLFGKPIIINQLAGAAELIADGKHGIHLSYQEGDQTEIIMNNLIASIQKLEISDFDPKQLSQNGLKYDTNNFASNFDQALQNAYQAKMKGKL